MFQKHECKKKIVVLIKFSIPSYQKKVQIIINLLLANTNKLTLYA